MKKAKTGNSLMQTFLTPWALAGAALWGIGLIFGLAGLYIRLTTGHLAAGYGSYVPWGIWVALYFHGVGIAAGVFAVGAVGFLTGVPGLASKAVLRKIVVLSLAAMFPGLLAVGLDLGHILRGSYIYLSPQFSSVMTLNAWLYTLFMGAVAVAWLLSWFPKSSWMKAWVGFGVALAVTFAAGSGMFLGVVQVKPAWGDGLWPVMMLFSGVTAGAAVLLMVLSLSRDDASGEALLGARFVRRVLAASLCAYLVLNGIQWMVGHWGTAPAVAGTHALAIPVFSAFWFRIVLGGFGALLLLWGRHRIGWALAGLLVAVSTLGGRLHYVLAGQTPAEMPGLVDAFRHGRLTFDYVPSVMEVQVSVLLVVFGVAVFVIGGIVNHVVALRVECSE